MPSTQGKVVEWQDDESVRVVTFVQRELGISFNTELLDEALAHAVKGLDCPHVLLNLANLAYIASKSIGSLIQFHKNVWRSGGEVRISNVPPYVMETFRAAKLHHLFDIYPTEEEGLQSFA